MCDARRVIAIHLYVSYIFYCGKSRARDGGGWEGDREKGMRAGGLGRLGAANDANRAHCAHKSNRRALNVAVRHSMLNHRQDGCIRRDERCGPGMCAQGSIWRRRLACALWRTQGWDVRAFLWSAFSLSQVGWGESRSFRQLPSFYQSWLCPRKRLISTSMRVVLGGRPRSA